MARTTPIKVSFNAGELSPFIDGRTDQSKFYNGCAIMENYLPLVEGPVTRRGGTYYAQETKTSSQQSWLFPFKFNVNQSYAIEAGNQYFRFFTNRGALVETAKTITGATQANPCVITSNSHGYANGDFVYLSGIGGMTQLNGGYYKVAGVTTNTFELQDQDGNNVNSSAFGAYTSGGSAFRVYQVVSPYSAADLTDSLGYFRLKFYQVGDVVYMAHPSYQLRKLVRSSNLSWAMSTVDLVNGPFKDKNTDTAVTVYSNNESGSVTLTASSGIFQSGHVGSLFFMEKNLSSTVTQWEVGKAVVIGDLRQSGNNVYVAKNAATTGSVKPTHTEGTVSDGAVNWEYHDSGFGIVRITGFTSSTVVSGTVITPYLPFGTVTSGRATYRWAHSLYSAVEGWPEYVHLFRERLVLSKGIIVTFSVAGDYENFAEKIGGEITDDAAITLPLPTQNSVRWMREAGDLLIGTGGDEIAVGKITTSDPFGPNNCEARKQSSYGSSNVEPELIGDEIVYTSRSGKRAQAMRYSFETANYPSSDLTILSRHITSAGITQIAYQQEPYSIVWAVTIDGYLIGLTFNREQDVVAWHRHPLGGNGIVESVCSIPSPDGTRDDLWLIVLREIDGVARRYVEWMTPEFEGTDATIADAFYVDCGLTYDGAATSTIRGAKHLKGMTVDILADGGAHPQKTVAADGSIALDFTVEKAQIGLPCPARIRTMRMEAGSQLGTAQGKIKRIHRMLARFYKTLGGKFGPDADHYDEIYYREGNQAMDTAPPLLTGDRSLPFPEGYNTEGVMEVYFDSPTPSTIISLVAEAEVHEN